MVNQLFGDQPRVNESEEEDQKLVWAFPKH